MKILTRYVLRQHVGPLLFALTTLTSLLLLNQIAKQFGNLVGKGLPWSVIGEFFLLSIPFIIAMTLPMSVLVATLYAFSRMAAENEITALKANGVGLARLLIPVLLAGCVLAALMIAFNDQLLPRSNHRLRTLQADIARKKPTFALREQVINEVSPGRLFLKAGRVDQSSNTMREVTIYDLSDPLRRRTVYADSGRMGMSRDRRDLQMMLFDGLSQEASADSPGELQRLYFDVDMVRVRGVANQLERTEEDTYKSDREMSICEMRETVEDNERQYRNARSELANLLAAAARRAATGTAPKPAREDGRAGDRMSLTNAYCDVILPFIGAGLSRIGAGFGPRQKQGGRDHQSSRATAPRTAEEDMNDAEEGVAIALPRDVPARAQQMARPAAVTVTQIETLRARLMDAKESVSRFDVEIHKKFALSMACVVFVLLGAPIALRFPRGGVGLVIGVSLVVFALYYVGLIAGETLADKLILPAVWSMWMANMLFTAIGLVLLVRVRKAGSTARGGDLTEVLDGVRGWAARQVARVGFPPRRERKVA